MNILLYDFVGSYMQNDLSDHLRSSGHNVKSVGYPYKDKYHDDEFESVADQELRTHNYDCVFTFNFFPLLAHVCSRNQIPYISWVYDSPPELPSMEYMDYSTNHIFFFSRADRDEYRRLGLDNVYHMPLAVNTERLDKCSSNIPEYGAEVSLVGKMYEPILPTLMTGMSEYQKGYIDGIIGVQTDIYGVDISDMLVTEEFAESVRNEYLSKGITGISPNRRELKWAVAEYITCMDRIDLLRGMADLFDTRLFTYALSDEMKSNLRGIRISPPVDYNSQMPVVFKSTKVNLCPILRANVSGIPLRAMDIMGCKAFLLASWQQELAEFFIPGDEVIMYGSIDEALELAGYFLKHDDERIKISERAYEKVRTEFSYNRMTEQIFKHVFGA